MTLLERILKDNNYKYIKGTGNDYIITNDEELIMLLDQNGNTLLEVNAKANGLAYGLTYANIHPEFEDYDELNELVNNLVETGISIVERRKIMEEIA